VNLQAEPLLDVPDIKAGEPLRGAKPLSLLIPSPARKTNEYIAVTGRRGIKG
jgi:hypothetical protein